MAAGWNGDKVKGQVTAEVDGEIVQAGGHENFLETLQPFLYMLSSTQKTLGFICAQALFSTQEYRQGPVFVVLTETSCEVHMQDNAVIPSKSKPLIVFQVKVSPASDLKSCVSIAYSQCKKLLQTKWLKTTHIYSFTVPEVRRPEIKVSAGLPSQWRLEQRIYLLGLFFQLLQATHIPGLVAPPLSSKHRLIAEQLEFSFSDLSLPMICPSLSQRFLPTSYKDFCDCIQIPPG